MSSANPRERKALAYKVKTLRDGVCLAFNHSLDTRLGYSVNDRVDGDAFWFEACGEARDRTAIRRG